MQCEARLTPEAVAGADFQELRGCGLSQRKAEYLTGLAQMFLDGHLSDEGIAGERGWGAHVLDAWLFGCVRVEFLPGPRRQTTGARRHSLTWPTPMPCDAPAAMDDETMVTELTRVRGLGAWSVHMFGEPLACAFG